MQGLTVTVWPLASGCPTGKVELETTKMQEAKRSVPPAVLPPEAIENPGAAAVPEKASVVVPVVPKPGTPEGNANVVPDSAAVTVPLAGMLASALATSTGVDAPPPAAAACQNKRCRYSQYSRKLVFHFR